MLLLHRNIEGHRASAHTISRVPPELRDFGNSLEAVATVAIEMLTVLHSHCQCTLKSLSLHRSCAHHTIWEMQPMKVPHVARP